MKTPFKILMLIVLSVPTLSMAQHDVKVNISNAMFYEFNMSYEYVIEDNISIGALGGYVYGFPDVDNPNQYFYVGPEFRYYISPKYGADRFYFGFYSRYKIGGSDATLTETGELVNQPPGNYFSYNQTAFQEFQKLAIGISVGSKWVTRDGFVFGFFGGLGRNLFSNYSDENFVIHENEFRPETYYKDYTRSDYDSESWDFRIGFNVGWRFGK